MFEGLGVLPDYDEPAESDLQLRQSTVESMMLCGWRQGYATEDWYDPTPSEAMFFGSVEHNHIEHHMLNGESLVLHDLSWTIDQIHLLAERDGFSLTDVTTPEGVKAMAREIIEAYRLWLVQWWAKQHTFLKPLAIEQRFLRPLGTLPNGRAVWVHGTPDVLIQSGMIDWKTAGRGWQPGKGEGRIQSPTYLWLAEEVRGVLEGLADYVVYNRQAQQWMTWTVPVGQPQIDAALHTLWQYAMAIDTGSYVPTPASPSGRPGRGWWCQPKFCGAWNGCKFKGLVADEIDLLQIRSKRWG